MTDNELMEHEWYAQMRYLRGQYAELEDALARKSEAIDRWIIVGNGKGWEE